MKAKIFIVSLLVTQSVFAQYQMVQPAQAPNQIAQAQAEVDAIDQMVGEVGATQNDSKGLLSALGQNHAQAEERLSEMKELQKRSDELAKEIKALHKESKDMMTKQLAK